MYYTRLACSGFRFRVLHMAWQEHQRRHGEGRLSQTPHSPMERIAVIYYCHIHYRDTGYMASASRVYVSCFILCHLSWKPCSYMSVSYTKILLSQMITYKDNFRNFKVFTFLPSDMYIKTQLKNTSK